MNSLIKNNNMVLFDDNNNNINVLNDINVANKKECEINCMQMYLNKLGEISYFCLICKGRIDHNNVIEHLQNHFNVHPYKCHICNNQFTDFEELLNHIKLHENNGYNNYDNQKENTNINSNVKQMIKVKKNYNSNVEETEAIANNCNKYLCYYCKLEFANPHARLHHLINHIENPFKCTICEISFKIKNNHAQHMLNHSAENQSDHTQDRLGRENTNKQIYIKKIIKTFWECGICVKKFDSYDKFRKHIIDHKNGILPIVLNYDATRSPKRKSRKRKPIEEYHSICHVCGKRFADNRNLRIHSVVHTRERNFECPICKKRFSQSNYIKAHMRIHTNEKPYKCKICDRDFRVSGALASHMLRHNNIRRHECTYCVRKFFDSDQLRAHIRTHTGEKPYQCDICKQYFRTSYCMKTHRRLHTGEKPFQCDYCDKRFAQLAGWHGHVKICRRNYTT